MSPVAGSIRSSEPPLIAYSESPLPVSESWANDWWLISSAPQMPPAIRGDVPAGVCDGAVEDGADDTEADVPPPGEVTWLWCELTATAMPALVPATANTLTAASTGAQPRFQPENPRRGRGSR